MSLCKIFIQECLQIFVIVELSLSTVLIPHNGLMRFHRDFNQIQKCAFHHECLTDQERIERVQQRASE